LLQIKSSETTATDQQPISVVTATAAEQQN